MSAAIAPKLQPEELSEEASDRLAAYLETLSYIERLHRLMLDVVKDEFERLGRADVNSVQALLLFNIGDNELTAGELRSRGYYQGSNVSYNLKKLVAAGYINHERSEADRRSVRVSLTEAGQEVRRIVAGLHQRHASSMIEDSVLDDGQLEQMNLRMRSLEAFWSDQIRYIY